jgi:hypothetical protein
MDDLDDLLAAKPVPPEPPAVREVIVRGAARVQRRRRLLVRGRRAAVLAVCYAAGLASMWYWSHGPEKPEKVVAERETPPDLALLPSGVLSADPYRNDPPERLEKWAFTQTGDKRMELYRRAGDGYLRRDDVQAALRCYRRALDSGSAEDLAIRADKDTWLFMSLKMARQKERPDARVN